MNYPNAQATTYNDKVVRQFAIMTVVWGVVGMLVGVIIAAQLTWPELNFGIPWLSYVLPRLGTMFDHDKSLVFCIVCRESG